MDIQGLLKDLLMGQQGIAPGGAPNGAVAPGGEQLTGPPVMGAGQREGGLLAGLGGAAMDASGLGPLAGLMPKFGGNLSRWLGPGGKNV